MRGAVIGDIIGSNREFARSHEYSFELFTDDCRFTDDTVLTVATADVLINAGNYAQTYFRYAREYPDVSWGGKFYDWVFKSENVGAPYNSLGNGSAMRVSPIGWYFKALDQTVDEARRSAEVTHNHPEGIKGAQAVAGSIFLARTGCSKIEIKEYIEKRYGYNLSRSYAEVQDKCVFDETCPVTVPEAIIAFLASDNFEDELWMNTNWKVRIGFEW